MNSEIIVKNYQVIDNSLSELDFVDLLLKNRQISNPSDFFKPHFPTSSDFNIDQKQLQIAIDRVLQAIKNQENILIYGDYDVDGLTSTATLWQVLHQKGAKILPFIPHRERDGYGVKSKSFFDFEKEKKLHFDLLITVDNGIVANQELKKIFENKTDIIIVDHHLPSNELPSATAIIHSTNFSGSGLSWFFASQFDSSADIGLAAAGTVADCLPLVGINRNLVIHGLQSLRLNPNPGIKKIIEISGIKADSISAYDLGFVIGPRLNAVGRLSDPIDALRLLCSQNSTQASKFAQSLEKFNKDRQELQKENLQLAETIIANNSDKLIFVAKPDFLPGIIGLIAGRLTEKYYLPSIIISVGDEFSKASCRSIKELNIIEALRQFDEDLVELGGHAGAAGFTIRTEKISEFQSKFTQYINQQLEKYNLKPSIIVDAEMKLSAVTVKNCKIINQFEPFGIDNPKPLFIFKNIHVSSKRVLGSNGDHLKLKFNNIDAIAFKKGHLDSEINEGGTVDIIASLDLNIWNNTVSPQLIIKEIITPTIE